ncbi:hypothetical protein Smp_151370 [Schistosoma mansoni]|uniref:hypothetical protein n=1 Tax=Schistosoma mansoni TaxID=6183 RepID=UPI00022C82F6|nr:hypothetical protein Smp_151370 [Schistosoma mansoni]|eukprot:XP_018647232.1 hypothetical protein Smp_151370 [Schistosoma mansoni]
MCVIKRLATIGDTGEPIATPFVCLYNVPLKVNRVEFKQSFNDLMIKLMLKGHLSDRVMSFSNKPLMNSKHISIGILAYKDTTSKLTMTSFFSIINSDNFDLKSYVSLIILCTLSCSGFN